MKNLPAVQEVKALLATDEVKNRFREILDKKAPQFMASIVNVISTNTSLQKCDVKSIMSSAFVAASFDLPIDQNLGFAAIVPYGKKAQFQMMYKGFVQLAIRSGQYKSMNTSEVFEDELISYNPITGQIKFSEKESIQRKEGNLDKVVGFYANFELLSGFKKDLYMSCDAVRFHAQKYSVAYKYDIRKKEQSSLWSTDFFIMGKKTVLKLLLSKYGVLSIQMQKALLDDQQVYNSSVGEYTDNPNTDTKTQDIKVEEELKKEIITPFFDQIILKLQENGIEPNDFWKAQKIESPSLLPDNDLKMILDDWDNLLKDYFTGE